MTVSKLIKQAFTFNSGSDVFTYANNNPDGVTLPTSTITVFSTASFTNSGQIQFYSYNGSNAFTLQTISYTSKNATQFLGCSGGTGTLFNYSTYPQNTVITQASNSSANQFTWTAPPGVKWVWVTGCGGGGGGGSGASVSSSNNAYPLFVWCIAGGGGGGQASVTSTHVIPVVPGVTYPVSIGYGGIGGSTNVVWNGAPFSGTPIFPNNYGGATWGNPGGSGQSSIFGTTVFAGGLGGKRGEILQRVVAVNEIDFYQAAGTGFPGVNANSNIDPGGNPIGSSQYNKTDPPSNSFPTPFQNPVLGGNVVQARTYGIWNPPGIVSSQFVLDQVLTIGVINNSQFPVANAAPQGLNNNWSPGTSGAGGGGGGGTSNNIYSVGGQGGQAAFGSGGNNFAYGGGFGQTGGGGGGGGGGEGLNYNNTHDGAPGGNGGAGFVEISWIQ
jgi:hypothetical protein